VVLGSSHSGVESASGEGVFVVQFDVDALARELRAAELDRAPIAPLTVRHPDLSVEDAYRIQLAAVERRIQNGARIRGRKVGLTSRAMQEMLGVGEPDFGYLLDDMFVEDGGSVPAQRFCAPRAEPEVAFILERPLLGPGCTPDDVVSATSDLIPAMEIIDSRIRDWRIALADTVADNASSAAVVLGSNRRPIRDVDIRTIPVTLSRNGEVAETGTSDAVLGNPAAAVAWLANKLSEFGGRLEAGEVVIPGACTRAVVVQRGDVVSAEFGDLGTVSVTFT